MSGDRDRRDTRGGVEVQVFDTSSRDVDVVMDTATRVVSLGYRVEHTDPAAEALADAVRALGALYWADPDDQDAVDAARERARLILEEHCPTSPEGVTPDEPEYRPWPGWEDQVPGSLFLPFWPTVDLSGVDLLGLAGALVRASAARRGVRVDGPVPDTIDNHDATSYFVGPTHDPYALALRTSQFDAARSWVWLEGEPLPGQPPLTDGRARLYLPQDGHDLPELVGSLVRAHALLRPGAAERMHTVLGRALDAAGYDAMAGMLKLFTPHPDREPETMSPAARQAFAEQRAAERLAADRMGEAEPAGESPQEQAGPDPEVSRFTVPQLHQVLALLGLKPEGDGGARWQDITYLTGFLLAYAELAVHLEGDDEQHTTTAYLKILRDMGGSDMSAGAMWSALMTDRVYRTSVHLGLLGMGDAGGRAHSDVAVASLLTGAAVMDLMNKRVTHDEVREGMNVARYNARALTQNLEALMAFVRGQGVELPDDIVDPDSVMGVPED